MKKFLVLLIALVGLAGCMTPQGQSTPPPIAKTATESSSISAECRASLAAIPHGTDLLNSYDVGVGGVFTLADPAAEAANLLSALRWGAAQLGVTTCG